MNWTALVCGVLCIAQGPIHPLGPIEVYEVPRGPRVVIRPHLGVPLVAIRISVPIRKRGAPSAEARVYQEWVRTRLSAELDRYGGEVQATISPTHSAYTLTVPAHVFRDVVPLLRRAFGDPRPSPRELRAAQIQVLRRVTAELEMPPRRARHELRQALFRTDRVLEGSPSVDAVHTRAIRAFWRRNYSPGRISVVLVGPIDTEDALVAFGDWPHPSDDMEPEPLTRVTPNAAEPEVILAWAGVGYSLSGSSPATVAVLAELITDRLAVARVRDAAAELWWEDGRQALAIFGSALTEADASSPTQSVFDVVDEAARTVEREEVITARRRLMDRILFAARTPTGLANVLGDFMDREGRVDEALRFVSALEAVSVSDVRSSLSDLLDRSPEIVEIVP